MAVLSDLLSHWEASSYSRWEINKETFSQTLQREEGGRKRNGGREGRRERVTVEHSTLNVMSLSSNSPESSGNHGEEEAERL